MSPSSVDQVEALYPFPIGHTAGVGSAAPRWSLIQLPLQIRTPTLRVEDSGIPEFRVRADACLGLVRPDRPYRSRGQTFHLGCCLGLRAKAPALCSRCCHDRPTDLVEVVIPRSSQEGGPYVRRDLCGRMAELVNDYAMDHFALGRSVRHAEAEGTREQGMMSGVRGGHRPRVPDTIRRERAQLGQASA